MELKLFAEGLSIVVTNRSPFEPVHTDERGLTYALDDDGRSHPTSRHAVEVVDCAGASRQCVLVAGGGPSGVHPHSAVVHDRRLMVAVGPHLCALGLPKLDLHWSVAVDDATCFGVYYSAKHDCYVSHGELAVARVALDGTIVWSAGGKDIFTEGFTLRDDDVEVVDFNHEKYRIDLATGRCSLVR